MAELGIPRRLRRIRSSKPVGEDLPRARSPRTVREAVWTVSDRCYGTLCDAIVHTILTQDFVRHISFMLQRRRGYQAGPTGKRDP